MPEDKSGPVMEPLTRLLASPLLPPLLLLLGPVILSYTHPTRTRPARLRLATLCLLLLAFGSLLALDFLPGVPLFAWNWEPLARINFQLLWLKMGWNWYISLLAGVLGIIGVLISGKVQTADAGALTQAERFYHGRFLSLNLTTVAAVWLLVSSANMLALVLMWVTLDIIMVIRQTLIMHQHEVVQHDYSLVYHRSLGLGILGSLVLLIGLFPAGVNGPGQMLVGAGLPVESIYALLLAAALRAGAYPLHLWLLPSSLLNLSAAERIFSHILPALTGIWLLGLTLDLAQQYPGLILRLAPWTAVAFCLSALTCLHLRNHSLRDSFVIVTAITMMGMIGSLAATGGTRTLLLPTTAFALGSALWLATSRLPAGLPGNALRALGACCLLAGPLTPAHAALAEWWGRPWPQPIPVALCIVLGILCFSAGLWQSLWRVPPRPAAVQPRFLVAALGLALTVILVGLAPQFVSALAEFENPAGSILDSPGQQMLASSAFLDYWLVTLGGGIALAWLLTRAHPTLRSLCSSLTSWTSLEWLSGGMQFGASRLSLVWSRMLSVLEGPGAAGWILTLTLLLWAVLH